MQPETSDRVKKLVQTIYLESLASVLNRRLAKEIFQELLIRNYLGERGSEYNPPS